jgi:hypothetical protein
MNRLKNFMARGRSAVMLLALAVVAMLAIMVITQVASQAQGSAGNSSVNANTATQPTTTNIWGYQSLNSGTLSTYGSFSNTVEIAPYPTGMTVYKRLFRVRSPGQLAITNQLIQTNITLTAYSSVSYSDTWVELTRAPLADTSHIYGFPFTSNTTVVIDYQIIGVMQGIQTPTNGIISGGGTF